MKWNEIRTLDGKLLLDIFKVVGLLRGELRAWWSERHDEGVRRFVL